MEKYIRDGSWGMHLHQFRELLDDPLDEEQLMRNWLLVKCAIHAAVIAAGARL